MIFLKVRYSKGEIPHLKLKRVYKLKISPLLMDFIEGNYFYFSFSDGNDFITRIRRKYPSHKYFLNKFEVIEILDSSKVCHADRHIINNIIIKLRNKKINDILNA